MPHRLTIAAVLLTATAAWSLPPRTGSSPWTPTSDPGSVLDFGDVALAEAGEDQRSLRIMIPQYRSETRTRIEPLTQFHTETRTQLVTLPNGRQVEQTYTVEVPVEIQQEVAYAVRVPGVLRQIDIPLDQVRAWALDGAPIQPAELLKQLKTTRHVLTRPASEKGAFQPIDPYFRGVLRDDCPVIQIP